MDRNICELCMKETDAKGKKLLETEKGKLEDCLICKDCYEEINNAQTQAEIDKIKEIKAREKNDIC